MNKRLLISIGLSLATVWGLQYWWDSRKAPVSEVGGATKVGDAVGSETGGPIKALTREDLIKPLNTAIAFEELADFEGADVTVQTPLQTLVFSAKGAMLTSLSFAKYKGPQHEPLKTIDPALQVESPVKGSFLLAFDGVTPIAYQHLGTEVVGGNTRVDFQAETKDWKIKKTYDVSHELYRIDLTVQLQAKGTSVDELRPRILIQAPCVAEVQDEAISTFMFEERSGKVEKRDAGSEAGYVWTWQSSDPIFGAQDKYFAHALVGDANKFVQRAYFHRYHSKSVYAILEGAAVKEDASWKVSCYCGPKLQAPLEAVEPRLGVLVSSGWLGGLSSLMLKFLSYIFSFVGNYGWAIILLTILLRLPIVPLSIYARTKQVLYQKHVPIINRIRQKFRGDAVMQQQEILRYHKEHDLSPATQAIGCLPLLIQIPILYSLYSVLGNHLELYQAPFFGWIIDLSAKDPYYILPILMGISMIWQQQMMVMGDDKQRFVMLFVSLVMSVVFASFPAGLVLYWFTNNMLIVAEEYLRRAIFSR